LYFIFFKLEFTHGMDVIYGNIRLCFFQVYIFVV
jgi:hypothetical protein